MDIQVKKGLLEACVLAALIRGDSYGYQLVKDISNVVEMSESTLYPIVKRLEAAGMLTVYSIEHNGRLRKYYRVTDSGRERLRGHQADWENIQRIYRFINQEDEND